MSDGRLPNKQIIKAVRDSETSGSFRFSKHAEQRLQQRHVSVQEVRQILKSGRREPRHDDFKPEFDNWNYAITGTTFDGRCIRIAVAIVSPGILIVTIIHLK